MSTVSTLSPQRRSGDNGSYVVVNDTLVDAVVALPEVVDGQLAVVFRRSLTGQRLAVDLNDVKRRLHTRSCIKVHTQKLNLMSMAFLIDFCLYIWVFNSFDACKFVFISCKCVGK